MTPAANLELNLLREWREPISPRQVAVAGAGSVLMHVLLIAILSALPGRSPIQQAPAITADLRKSVPLYLPRELTQRDANKGKVTQTLDVRSSAPPAPAPQAPRFRPPAAVRGPAATVPIPAPPAPSIPPPTIEDPKIEVAEAPPPPPASGRIPQILPPPQKPKLAFERVGAGGSAPGSNPNPMLKLPNSSLDEAAQAAISSKVQPNAPSSQGGNGMMIGDIDEMTTVPVPGATPSNGPVRSNLQLLSDPKGVDFKPYLIQVLTAVRTNWLAVIPESARFGRRGRVLVQFIIDRKGSVPKLVIAESSGTSAFDRAAVAGISASNPFPPLPAGYKGDEIRLQLAFSYNVPSR